MQTEPRDDLAPEVGAKLDRLLKGWAAEQQLSSRQAETIRLAVTRADAGLDAAWWQELFGQPGRIIRNINAGVALSATWVPVQVTS